MEAFILIKSAGLIILIMLSVICDIRSDRISNGITMLFSLAGILCNFIEKGVEGIAFSLMGWFVPVALLFMLFVVRMLGAGDIKLFAAIGAMMGSGFAVKSILYSFLIGGCICLVLLIMRKNGKERFLHIWAYIRTCLKTCTISEYADFGSNSKEDKFHFSCAVAPAVILQITAMYLSIWGG
jgi:prepilin peptidase CpaA